jgi:hypothetical protein
MSETKTVISIRGDRFLIDGSLTYARAQLEGETDRGAAFQFENGERDHQR